MKKTMIYLLLWALVLGACSKKEDFDGIRVDERLSEHLVEYEAQLIGAENGWLGYLYPQAGGAYTFRFVFSDDNRVSMQASMNAQYASNAWESSYRLRATQVPSLYFDTYSYIHVLADPDPLVGGGPAGQGQWSDFEFAILSVTPDTIRLKGNHNGSDLVLIRASETQGEEYVSEAYAYNQQINQFVHMPYYYNRLSIDGREYAFTVNAGRNTVNFYSDNEGFMGFTTTYATLDNGILLRSPFVDGDLVISELNDFNIDTQSGIATVRVGGIEATITNESDPIVIDPSSARRMYIASYSYTSGLGFTVGGHADADRLSEIPGYLGMQYIPRRYVDGYDAFMFYFNHGAGAYTAALNTHIETDGRFTFSYVGWAGMWPGGEYDVAIQNTLDQLFDPQGYYVYWTGASSYDLVSVSDSKRWIRFY